MVTLKLSSDRGDATVNLAVPEPGSMPSAVIFAYPKSGSVMLDDVIENLSKLGDRPNLNIEKMLFTSGRLAEDYQNAIEDILFREGYLFGVFRGYLDCFRRAVPSHKTRIYLIRDPRDVLVSYYYSMRQSHWVPEVGTSRESLLGSRSRFSEVTLDEAILRGEFDSVIDNMIKFGRMIQEFPGIVFRYEDVVFRKGEWIKAIASELNISLPKETLEGLLSKHDIFPLREDESAHIRRVIPGDFRQKVGEGALRHLETEFSQVFELLGYSPHTHG